MRYAIVSHTSILTRQTKTEVWDEGTVQMAEKCAPDWQVDSWHDTKEVAQAEMEDKRSAGLDRVLFEQELGSFLHRHD